MNRYMRIAIGGPALALLLALPMAAAHNPAGDTARNHATTVRSAWPPESLSGKITMVKPDEHLLVVQDANGVPFDLTITHNTRIMANGQRVTLDSLTQDQNQSVSIRFIPERRGDVAESIHIGG